MLIYYFKTDLCAKNKRIIRNKLLRYALCKNFGIDIKNIEFDRNEYGKPYIRDVPDIYFNISHCKKVIACSVGSTIHGIDIEEIRDFDNYVAGRVFSIDEQKKLKNTEDKKKYFFTIWTLKESFGKAKGTGLNYNLRNTTFNIYNDGITCSDNSVNFKTYEINGGYILSVATKEAIKDIEIKEVVMKNGELDNVR